LSLSPKRIRQHTTERFHPNQFKQKIDVSERHKCCRR
jgi:hypothetical protein